MKLAFLTDLYEKDLDKAKSTGWAIDVTDLYKDGPTLIKGHKVIWKVEEGKWVCADMVSDGYTPVYHSHRRYKSLSEALACE